MMKQKSILIIITALALIFSIEPLLVRAQSEEETGVIFLSPKEDDLWTGEQQIEIKISHIEAEEIELVEFYLDGRLLKEFTAPPYALKHRFGGQGQNHTLKVVVRGTGLMPLASAQLKSFQVDQAIDVEVQQVVVPVTVLDKKGNYVRGLKQNDFIALADDKPIEISYLSTRGTEKFNMVQVVDISYSMRDKIHDVLQASQEFTLELLTGKDKGTFVFFNQRVYDHMGFTSDIEELVERLDLRAPVMGGTALFDAMAYSLNLMSKTPGWNIMVVFSDGWDNSSYIDRYSLAEKVKQSPVVIFGIDNRESEANDALAEMCSLSGGMVFPLLDVKKTNLVYEKIREEIKAQYILYFNPAEAGKRSTYKRFHPLTVKVKGHDEYEIRALKGYYY